MSNLSDLLPAGASAKSITATDSGSGITSGKPVILETAGTVTEVVESGAGLGTPVEITSSTAYWIATTFDSTNNKIVEIYSNRGDYNSYAAVGTVSGTDISFGTPVGFDYNTAYHAVTYDSDANRVVIAYQDISGSNYGTAVVGTVSGTSISFGTAVVFESAGSSWVACTFDSDANKVVIAYRDEGNSNYGTAIVGTVSGTSISFGTAVVFESAETESISATFDSNSNKVVISYKDAGNSEYGTSIVGTVSGTAISFGTAVVFESAVTEYISSTFDSDSNQIVVTYRDEGNSNYGTAIVGTVSGTAISFGTPVVYETAEVTYQSVSFDSNANRVLISYKDVGNSNYGTNIVGTVSGTSISFGSAAVFSSATTNYISTAFDSNENAVVTGYTPDAGPWAVVESIVATNLTTSNFLGIADEAISASASGVIVVQGGTSAKLTSLTTGGKYYVQDDGTLTSPDATEAYSINGATYDSVSFDVTQDSTITGMCFNDDGTKMYVCGESSDKVYQYSLSSAYDLSTASYDSVSLDVSSQQGAPRSVVFNNDGSALYIVGTSAAAVHQYTLSTEYDLSTASYSSNTFSVASQELYPCGAIFNNDGASMYVVGSQNDTVYQYTLSTPFDVSTASYASKSLDGSSEQSGSTGLAFNSDGTKIFIIGETPTKIFQYTLSSAYDASTGSYDSVSYTYSEGSVPRDIVWGNSGNKFYIPDSGPDDIYQYTPGGGASSSVNAGLALSATQLLLNGDS